MFDRVTDPIGWLVDNVLKYGFEYIFKRYYGTYKGKVIDIADPEKRNRLRVQVPEVGQDTEGAVSKDLWAEADSLGLTCSGEGKQIHGVFYPPQKGDYVWVRYEQGDLSMPVYSGGWLPSNGFKGHEDVIEENNLYKGIKTRSGHLIKLSDKEGDLSIKIIKGDGSGGKEETEILLNEDKSILLRDRKGQVSISNSKVEMSNSSGSKVSIDGSNLEVSNSNGNKLSLSSGQASIESSAKVIIKAPMIVLDSQSVTIGSGGNFKPILTSDAALNYNLHTHPVIGAATGPPVTQVLPGNGISLTTKST